MINNSLEIGMIVVDYNHPDETLAFVDLLVKQKVKNASILVVANGSNQDSINILNSSNLDFELLIMKKNKGWTGGVNEGAKYFIKNHNISYILICSYDLILGDNCISSMLNTIKSNKNIAAVGPKVYYQSPRNVFYSVGMNIFYPLFIPLSKPLKNKIDKGQIRNDIDVNWIDDVILLIKADVFSEVGMHDEDYFMYVEETDLSYRLIRNGYGLKICASSKVWHKGHASSGGGEKVAGAFINEFVAYYIVRNRILFFRKNISVIFFPFIVLHILVFFTIQSIFALRRKNYKIITSMVKGILWHLKN